MPGTQSDPPVAPAIKALDVQEAIAAIEKQTKTAAQTQHVRISEALGCFAAQDIATPINLPPFPASAMDGYALDSRQLSGDPPYRLNVVGESLAGHAYRGTILPGQCVRITTGAPVPADADAVVIQENCTRDGDALTIHVHVPTHNNIRPTGNDIRAGSVLVSSGKRLNAFDIGWLSACGVAEITVRKPVRVALFSTGDELVEAGEPLTEGCIYDANRILLTQLLRAQPVVIHDLGILPDDMDALRTALTGAAAESDLLLTSGGVSVGDADLVRDVVEELGRIDFWRIRIKPGKPLAFGHIGPAAFLGLPGNPASAVVTFLLFGQPLIRKLAGGLPRRRIYYPATLDHPIPHSPGRDEFRRGCLDFSAGRLLVSSRDDQSSNRLASFSNADCLIRIPGERADLDAGTVVEVLPFFGLISER
ncbi:MAG: molybdopterin molybdotransferase MoeA [Pseudomonadales bacterium]|nr:molybdopterin molybdotransferase MoeA [Pseudomonadales bacterium]